MTFEQELFDYQMNDMLKISIKEAELIKRINSRNCLDKQRVRELVVDIMKESDWNEYQMKNKLKKLGLS